MNTEYSLRLASVTISAQQAKAMGWQFPPTQQRSLEKAFRGRRFSTVKIALASLLAPVLISPQTAFAVERVETPPPALQADSGSTFLTSQQQSSLSNLLIGLAYSLPVGGFLGVLLYDRYCQYRAAVLREQIQRLERAWQQSIYPYN
ncbi:hypothetical protein H6G20_11380 [Desertifilum sp. FACHB-1129]|uniref:Uncharacterized protein n=1 Tax=Desertifilum tharense IPPAS B-1220 TaxID=1781255 RepID=A0A1E5QR36_9CYAN|nr:hypothetical protein [Desertifilum tharense]MBD2312265.1 hypothetical protein [Desertifilum sp. FACHB-1129]MBD2323668.1 hypothetical protein [Desertifilum sp. FACHB-866]MBD2332365.1 hypothetical protein [Desertifilum sp. FACHB-868]MDA0210779.1 hypothetical protein [Cyanobacteria bacterium FC1]OEJ77057.1 hypothetical protein BH720_01080 [Desertifilum tharense IPPAS B-1220]